MLTFYQGFQVNSDISTTTTVLKEKRKKGIMLSFKLIAFLLTLLAIVTALPAPTGSHDGWNTVPPRITRSAVNGDKSYYYGGSTEATHPPENKDLIAAAKLAYTQMQHAAKKNEALPATMSALYVPSKHKIFFRSSIKGSAGGMPSNAITIYDPKYPHATNGNCAEINAISVVTTKDVAIPGSRIATYGLRSDGSGPEPLNPCLGKGDICGCQAYLDHYEVEAIV